MKNPILKAILVGALVGATLFLLPFFLLRAVLFVLLIGGLLRLLGGWGWRRRNFGYAGGFHPAFADTIRRMNEEEYQAFRQQLAYPCGPSRPTQPGTAPNATTV